MFRFLRILSPLITFAISPFGMAADSHEAAVVVLQQGVSGYGGASEKQAVNGAEHDGTFLRAAMGAVISDVSPVTEHAIEAIERDASLSDQERTGRLAALVPQTGETSSFTLTFDLSGIPASAPIATAIVNLTVCNLRERSDFQYAGGFFAVSATDPSVELDVTDPARVAIAKGGPLEIEIKGMTGAAWFCGNRDRHAASRPKLTIMFKSPQKVDCPAYIAPTARSFLDARELFDPQRLARCLQDHPGLKAARIFPVADSMVGDRADQKGEYRAIINAPLNFGMTPQMNVRDWTAGFNFRAFIKFDLSPLERRAIRGAALNMYCLEAPKSNAENVRAYAVEDEFDDWQEDSITWLNQPDAACQYLIRPLASRAVGPSVPDRVNRWYGWDIGEYVDDELANGNRIASLCLKDAYTESHSLPVFCARESGVRRAPYLLVLYEGDDVAEAPLNLARPEQGIPADHVMLLDFESAEAGDYTAVGSGRTPLPVGVDGATHGNQALSIEFSGDNAAFYVHFTQPRDISRYRYLCFDVTYESPDQAGLGLSVLLDDPDPVDDWAKNYHCEDLGIVPGRATIRMPIAAMRHSAVDLRHISLLHIWLPGDRRKPDAPFKIHFRGDRPDGGRFFIDAIRLEQSEGRPPDDPSPQ